MGASAGPAAGRQPTESSIIHHYTNQSPNSSIEGGALDFYDYSQPYQEDTAAAIDCCELEQEQIVATHSHMPRGKEVSESKINPRLAGGPFHQQVKGPRNNREYPHWMMMS